MSVYRKQKSDGSWDWYIDYRFQGRRLRERIGPNRAQAGLVLQKRRVEIAEGRFLEKRQELNTTLGEMAALYVENYARPSKKTWRDDKRILGGFVKYFGNARLSEITPLKLEAYRADHRSKLKPATLNRHIAAIKTMFSKAIEWGKATGNPALKVKLYSENNARARFLEKGEIAALLAASPEWLRPIITVAICSGMRKAEILGLTWDDVDLQNMVLRIRDSKNGSARFVPMSLPVLQTLRSIQKVAGSPYVFASPGSRTLLYGRVRYAFDRAVKEVGLSDVVFHTLRHSAASHLVMGGVDISTVGAILGHKCSRMTERYSHLAPAHKSRAIKALDSIVPAFQMDTQVDKTAGRGSASEADAFAKIAENTYENSNLFPGGEMVSQRTLNPLFLVRVQAWEGGLTKEA